MAYQAKKVLGSYYLLSGGSILDLSMIAEASKVEVENNHLGGLDCMVYFTLTNHFGSQFIIPEEIPLNIVRDANGRYLSLENQSKHDKALIEKAKKDMQDYRLLIIKLAADLK